MPKLSESIDVNRNYSEDIPPICIQDISIVIPVKNNEQGLDRFLTEFFSLHTRTEFPKEIIVIDNNSSVPLVIREEHLSKGLPIRRQRCEKIGPAAARNLGVSLSTGQWILFCDSDCVPTRSLLRGYLESAPLAVAYAGGVVATPPTLLSQFYEIEGTLRPYLKLNESGELVPLYIVTANALVWRQAFLRCGGFNESFLYAAGEDVDLSRRLWQVGGLLYQPRSVVLHNFDDGLLGLCRRFMRYGRGNYKMSEINGISMQPRLRWPKDRSIFNLLVNLLRHACLWVGYYTEKNGVGRRDYTITASPSSEHIRAEEVLSNAQISMKAGSLPRGSSTAQLSQHDR
jgi:glycosyltransferase involved in cell wall biosynthesis